LLNVPISSSPDSDYQCALWLDDEYYMDHWAELQSFMVPMEQLKTFH